MFTWTILKARLYTYVEGNVTIRELMDDEVCARMSILAPEATVCARSRAASPARHGHASTLFHRQEELTRC